MDGAGAQPANWLRANQNTFRVRLPESSQIYINNPFGDGAFATGLVHAIGMVNFLFDKTQSPHSKASDIYSYFGVSSQTGQAHSKKIRDLLRIGTFDPKWILPSQLDNSPMAWMLEVNGFMLDIRTMPLEIQIEACAKGLIPYVPALRDGPPKQS